MTKNRRILLNIVATYMRSLYGLAIGLFCGRWTLKALGEIDYGLYGLVGGLSVFIIFINNVLAGANARFYAISIGAASVAKDKDAALEESRLWFNTALCVHSVIPILLILIGYPIGVCVIESFLEIPPERVFDCIWVFRFVCVSSFFAMINVPFSAMYGAKQYIAELTVYSFVTATLNVVVLYYMITHNGVWLVKFALWNCLLSVVPQVIICLRAWHIFPECCVVPRYMWNWSCFKMLSAFVSWQVLGAFCAIMRVQGLSIVVNKLFGARMNAAQSIGTSVEGHCTSLASAIQGSFVPVITQAYGAGDFRTMNIFVIRTCKFNAFLSLIFMIPLALELPEVMRLWLETPPAYATGLGYCAMLVYLVNAITAGHMIAINATGKIAAYHGVMCLISVFTLPVCALVGLAYRNIFVIMTVAIFFQMILSCGRLYFAQKHARSSIRRWLQYVLIPLVVALTICPAFGSLPRFFMPSSFARVCLTAFLCETMLIPLFWFVLLDDDERSFLIQKVNRVFNRQVK